MSISMHIALLIMVALTQRENDVLRLIVQGLSNREIAVELTIRESTARDYVSAVMFKLDARNRTHCAVRALRSNLVE